MPYCTSCGNEVAGETKFCARCGATVGGAAAAPAAAGAYFAPAPEPLEYNIQGSNLQILRLKLKAGQEVYAEAGKMVYKVPGVSWDTRMTGETIGQKIWGAVKRKLMGESLFMTYFRAPGGGEVGFAGDYPGRLQCFDLKAGQSILVQRDSFICAQTTVQLNIALVKKLGAGFFGGEGFILEKLTGPGMVFIHAGGDFVDFTLGQGEVLQVDTGCIVGFDETVGYDIQFVGGIKTAIFGGEGLFLATLTGPGKVLVQSMTLQKLRRELSPEKKGGDERTGLDALSGLFNSQD
jgi:uncharacterized protein (TIGR00266 family)